MGWRDVWRGLFPRRHIEGDVREEIRFHIEERIRELVAVGWSEAEATAQVLERFGDVGSIEDACRIYDVQRVEGTTRRMVMEAWIRDVRLAVRGMRRSPGFTAVLVVMLALGIGASTSVFSVVEQVLLRPLPFPDADRLVMVWENDRATGTTRENASGLDYYDFVERARGFDGMAMYERTSAVLQREGSEPRELTVAKVTTNLSGILGTPLELGRSFTDEEARPDGAAAVILSDRLWRSAYDADPGVVGRTIDIDDVPHTVVGVTAPDLDFPTRDTDAWLPSNQSPTTATRSNHYLDVVARMAPGTTLEAAQGEMTRIMAELEAEFPNDNTNRGAFVERLSDVGRADLRLTLWVLFGSVLTVLAIACVNVANLLLARGASRIREIAVHTALGAGAGQLRRRFLVEGILMTALAAGTGILLAALGVRGLAAIAPQRLLRFGPPTVDGPVLLYAVAISVVIGVVFGLLPTLQAGRTDLQSELKEGRTSESHTPRLAARRLLVATQLAMAVMLLVGATLLMRTLANLQSVDPGFQTANTLRVDFTLPASRYPRNFANWPNWTEVHQFNHTLLDRVAALPGARSAALVTNHPLDAGFTNSFAIEGVPYDPDQGEITTRMVTPGYFDVVGLRLVEGRLPTASEGPDAPGVIVINQKAVERYFPKGGAIGTRMRFWGAYREVVGIVANERVQGLATEPPPALYVSLFQSPPVATKLTLMVRTAVPPLELTDAVRRAIWSVDPQIPVFNVATMEDTLADATARERFASLVLLVFSGVAVFLSVLGVHGVLAYVVAQRGHEVGVRMALGATRRNVIAVIVRQGAAMAGVGIAVGVLGALGASRVLQGLLFGVSATAPWAYAAVAVGLGLVSLAATALPAWRAASIDPVAALRGE